MNQSLVYVRPFSPLFQILFFPLQFSSQKNCCWVVKYWGGAFGFPPPPPKLWVLGYFGTLMLSIKVGKESALNIMLLAVLLHQKQM